MRSFQPHSRHSRRNDEPPEDMHHLRPPEDMRHLRPSEETAPPVQDDSAVTQLSDTSNIQSNNNNLSIINQSMNNQSINNQSNKIPPQATGTGREEAVCKSEQSITPSDTPPAKGEMRAFPLTKLVFPELGGTGPLSVSTKNNRGVGALMVSFESTSLEILRDVLKMSEQQIRERIPTIRKVVQRPLSQPWLVKGRVSKAHSELSADEFTYEHSMEYLQSLRRVDGTTVEDGTTVDASTTTAIETQTLGESSTLR